MSAGPCRALRHEASIASLTCDSVSITPTSVPVVSLIDVHSEKLSRRKDTICAMTISMGSPVALSVKRWVFDNYTSFTLSYLKLIRAQSTSIEKSQKSCET